MHLRGLIELRLYISGASKVKSDHLRLYFIRSLLHTDVYTEPAQTKALRTQAQHEALRKCVSDLEREIS